MIKWIQSRLGAGALMLALCFPMGCQQTRPAPPPGFPAREAPNYEALVSVTWVKSLLDFHCALLAAIFTASVFTASIFTGSSHTQTSLIMAKRQIDRRLASP